MTLSYRIREDLSKEEKTKLYLETKMLDLFATTTIGYEGKTFEVGQVLNTIELYPGDKNSTITSLVTNIDSSAEFTCRTEHCIELTLDNVNYRVFFNY